MTRDRRRAVVRDLERWKFGGSYDEWEEKARSTVIDWRDIVGEAAARIVALEADIEVMRDAMAIGNIANDAMLEQMTKLRGDVETMRLALAKITDVSGTSTEHYHIAKNALARLSVR